MSSDLTAVPMCLCALTLIPTTCPLIRSITGPPELPFCKHILVKIGKGLFYVNKFHNTQTKDTNSFPNLREIENNNEIKIQITQQ